MPHRTVTWKDRWRYRFENTLSRGTVAIIGWLALVSLIIVVLAAVALALIGVASDPNDVAQSQLGFVEGAWQSLMHTLDARNLAALGGADEIGSGPVASRRGSGTRQSECGPPSSERVRWRWRHCSSG